MSKKESIGSLTLRARRRNSLLLCVAVAAACTRGLVESIFDRTVAYLLQLLLIILPLGLILISTRGHTARHRVAGGNRLNIFGLVFAFSLLSALTTMVAREAIGLQYFAVILFTWFLVFFTQRQARDRLLDFDIAFWGAIIIAVLVAVVGITQQLLVFPLDLPGYTNLYDILRPPSLTASYLHYPLIISMAACMCYCALLNKVRLTLLPMVFLTAATFASFSRSGMLILLAGFTLPMLADRRHFVKASFTFAVVGLLLFFLSPFLETDTLSIVDRLASTVDIQSEGNDTRYEIWTSALDKLSLLNVFIGTFFGLVTNSAPEEIRNIYGIVESSPLQQILNIGIIGTIFFYVGLFGLTRSTGNSDKFTKFVIIAGLLQTFFYQSIEVIPFLVMLMMTVVVSNALEYRNV